MKRLVLVAAGLLLVGGAALGLAQMEPSPRETVQSLTVPLPPIAPAAAPAPVQAAAPAAAPQRAALTEAPKPEPARKSKAKDKPKTRSHDG
jgi:hypothetical protein